MREKSWFSATTAGTLVRAGVSRVSESYGSTSGPMAISQILTSLPGSATSKIFRRMPSLQPKGYCCSSLVVMLSTAQFAAQPAA